jgi:hypothetical protein
MPMTLTITLDEAGSINVAGPLDNPILCYGLIELGRQSIADHLKKLQDRLVQPASMLPRIQ